MNKPRQIQVNSFDFPDGYRIEVLIPKDRVKHHNAIQDVAVEILYAAECEASRSFFLYDQYGNQVVEHGS